MAKRAKKASTTAPSAPVKVVPAVEQWPAHVAERWPIERIKPNPRNARTHPEKQLAQLEALFREYGQTKPVLVDEADMLIAGHGTWMGAKRAGCTEMIVVVARGWTDEQKRAYALADNQVALRSTWDEVVLGIELADLSKLRTVDMSLIGFTQRDCQRLIAAEVLEGQTDPDAAESSQRHPISRMGDLWILGRHRLLCGDSTNADHVTLALGELRPLLMVTDPPYGVEYDPAWRDDAAAAGAVSLKSGGNRASGEVTNDDNVDWRAAWALFPGDVAYVWHAGVHASRVQASLEAAGFGMRAQIIWAKERFVVSRGDYHWQHEPCWYAVREGATGHWAGDRSQSTLWRISHLKNDTGHGTQKPVECMQRPIINNSKPGDAIYEPFAGSGTTIIAAEQTHRACAAIEIDPAYVDVTVARWEAFTGLRAVLAAGGEEYADVSARRRSESLVA